MNGARTEGRRTYWDSPTRQVSCETEKGPRFQEIETVRMATKADVKLADALRREVEYYSQPGAHEASIAEEQDWLNTARLAVGFLEAPDTTDEQREAARNALKHTPPLRS